ncbi:MAG TPA: acyltransferase family protein, partial [Ktedonobacterales bacterium]
MSSAAKAADAPSAAAPTARSARGGHLGYVDGARGIAAVYVALHHCWQIVWSETPHPLPFLWSLLDWLAYGSFAVSAFIAISGFSLMLPVARGDGRLPGGAWTFFKRRARRILPPYYFA